MKNMKKTLAMTLSAGVSVMLTACGGGSSTTENAVTNLPLVKIDSANKKEVTAILFDSVDMTTPKLPNVSSTNDAGSPLTNVLPTALLAKSSGVPYSCSEGGSIVSSEADGNSVITYENCTEAGTTVNGEIKVAYNETSQTITYTLTDYSLSDNSGTYTTSNTLYTVSSGRIAYTTTGTLTNSEQTLNFNNYSYALSLTDNKVDISIDGSLKTDTLGNWITIKSDKTMQLSDNTCPLSGAIIVTGKDSTLNLTFSSDKSIDVILNNALVQSYGDCNKLPTEV